MTSKYIDTPSCMQVIGAIYLNPSLLDSEKYNFNQQDFTQEFHQVIFGSIYNLHALGAATIDVNTIEVYLEQRPKRFAVYKANNGAEYLNKLQEVTQPAAFDYYYKRMKKFTLFRMYQEQAGMDLSWLYDPDNIFDQKKKQEQEDWLDNTPIEQIAETIDGRIEQIKAKYIDNADTSFTQAGSGIDDLIVHLMNIPEIGYPLYGEINNAITRGRRLGKLYLRSAATGVGKAIPNDTIIPTPSGFKRVDEIREGDYLFDGLGKPTQVKAVFPQGLKDVWKVTFKDGREALCNEEHLWSFCTEGQRKEAKLNRKFTTKTLKEINQMALYKQGHGYQILIPNQKAVQYTEKQYSLAPYSFGLLLGDGSFRYDTSQKGLTFSSENAILPSYIAEEMGWTYKKSSTKNYSWMFELSKEDQIKYNHINVWVEDALKDYPTLWNVKSEDKFIPREYLEGSIKQRLDLLNGLLDSDGSIDSLKGRVSVYTISSQLKDDIITLSRSLGFTATYLIDRHKETSECYKIEIAGTPENKAKLFRLPRKKELIENWYNNGKRKELNLFNPIIAIENCNYQTEMTCFLVDNPEHLFLMNDFIVTHNTRAMIADACTVACSELYNLKTATWEPNGTKEPVIYISTEQQLDEIQTMMLAFIADVNEDHILYNKYIDDELARVKYAAKVLAESNLQIKRLPDFSLQDIENMIRFSVREFGTKYIFHDYLHSSMKILAEVSGKAQVKGLREDNVLFMIAVRLKDLAVEHGVFIETATQLNAEYRSAQIYDQNLLRGAKSIADKIDLGEIMLDVSNEDRESLRPLIQQNGLEVPDTKISIYKNRRGRYKDVLVWCVSNKATCKITPIFVTDYQYTLIDVPALRINIQEESAF